MLDKILVFSLNFKNLNSFVTGVTVPKLNQKKLRQIPIPPLAEQKQIAERLDTLSEKTTERLDTLSEKTTELQENYRKKIQNLVELKNSLLKKAFNGEL